MYYANYCLTRCYTLKHVYMFVTTKTRLKDAPAPPPNYTFSEAETCEFMEKLTNTSTKHAFKVK